MVQDVAAQVPSNVAFLLVDQDEPQSVVRHVLEKVHLPVQVLLDNCESGQSCQQVGSKLYQQPDSMRAYVWFPFSRSYVIKVLGQAPPSTSLQVTAILTGYDPAVVLCKIEEALGN